MKRLLIFLLFLGVFPINIQAQDADSLLFVDYQWNTKTIQKGITWKQANISGLFGSTQEINYVEIDLKRHAKHILLAAVGTGFKRTSDFAAENDAIIAINGGFFDTKNGGGVDMIKVNGILVNETRNANVRANAYFVFRKKGKAMKILSLDTLADQEKFPNMMLSGPLLVENGLQVELDKNAFNQNRHPRSAIAIRGNTLILLTIDGRNSQAQGMSLSELAKVFVWLGAGDAMNLDGGGSTALYIKGQTETGIVNHPSDNGKFDHQGERRVANAILVK